MWLEAHQLCGIADVTIPNALKSRGRHEVLPTILFLQKRSKALKLVECFTWNIPTGDLSQSTDHAAALRLTATNNADKAAGVTPAIREA